MTTTYTHLSADERDQLAVLKASGKSLRQIARRLGRSPSSLSRELRRNSSPARLDYFARPAHLRSSGHKSRASSRPVLSPSPFAATSSLNFVCAGLRN